MSVIGKFRVEDDCGNVRFINKNLGELNPRKRKEIDIHQKLIRGAQIVQKEWCFSHVTLHSFRVN